MNVYIVMIDYGTDGFEIDGVFATRELAQEHLDDLIESHGSANDQDDWLWIEEKTVIGA